MRTFELLLVRMQLIVHVLETALAAGSFMPPVPHGVLMLMGCFVLDDELAA
jgi:hypothetical protein